MIDYTMPLLKNSKKNISALLVLNALLTGVQINVQT